MDDAAGCRNSSQQILARGSPHELNPVLESHAASQATDSTGIRAITVNAQQRVVLHLPKSPDRQAGSLPSDQASDKQDIAVPALNPLQR
jgi:hypothetical protein